MAGGVNLYGFGGGDPVTFSDPFGLGPCIEAGNQDHDDEEPTGEYKPNGSPITKKVHVDCSRERALARAVALAQHGKQNINMDNALVRGITKQSSPEEIQAAMERVRQALNSGEVVGARAAALRGWLKVASRGFRVAGVIGILYGVWDAITSVVSPPVACSGTPTGC